MKIPPQWQLPEYSLVRFKPKKSKYCIVIPVFNEGKTFIDELSRMKKQLAIDVIIADGGSTDGGTKEATLKSLGVSVLMVKRGPGKLSSQLRMGYAYALSCGYQGIITIDGNGKDDVRDVYKFTKALDEGYDYVQGSRFLPGGRAIHTPLERFLGIRLIHAPIVSLGSGFHFTDTTNGFRGYSRRMLLDQRVQPFRNIFQTYELLAYISVRVPRLGLKTLEIPVTRQYPRDRVPTKIHFWAKLDLVRILILSTLGFYNPA